MYRSFFKTVEVKGFPKQRVESVQCIVCENAPANLTGRIFGQFLYTHLNGTNNLDKHAKSSHSELPDALGKRFESEGRMPSKTGGKCKKRNKHFLKTEVGRKQRNTVKMILNKSDLQIQWCVLWLRFVTTQYDGQSLLTKSLRGA